MTCQELLAFSVAFSAALPTNQNTLDSFYSSLARTGAVNTTANNGSTNAQDTQISAEKTLAVSNTRNGNNAAYYENFSCCYHLYQSSAHAEALLRGEPEKTHFFTPLVVFWKILRKILGSSHQSTSRP